MKILSIVLLCAFSIASISAQFRYLPGTRLINCPRAVYNPTKGWTRATQQPFPFTYPPGKGAVGPSGVPDINAPVTGLDPAGDTAYCNMAAACNNQPHAACSKTPPNIANCKKAALAPMTDEFKTFILNAYNNLRNNAIKGNLVGAGNVKLPVAKAMQSLTWSDELRAIADLYNKNCNLNEQRCFGTKAYPGAQALSYSTGQTGIGYAPEKCFTDAFEAWKSGISSASPNDINRCCQNMNALSFYQLVMGDAKVIGCSIVYYSEADAGNPDIVFQMCLVTCIHPLQLSGGQPIYK